MDQDARKLQGLLYLYAEKSHPHIRKRFVLKRALYASFMVAFIAGTYGSTSRDAAIHYAGLVVLVATIVTAFILFIMTLIQKKKLSDLRQACIDAYTERFIVKNLEHYFD